ncbi:MAG: saccharopine dehydrogenase NADP-binding domain-containing protein, partial [Solirubrobacteraceae bacterium]
MPGRIVVFGATGYTGERTARALVARGAQPLLAARSAERLELLAAELGGLETRVADVSRPESVRALVQPGDVLISTVGPFLRWGAPAIEAAIDAGAIYIDSTGEPAFIRRVFEHYGPQAQASGASLLTAFAYDWVPGNLAGALALTEAGELAVGVRIGYFGQGEAGSSGGTQASLTGAFLEPSFAFRGGRLRTERVGARVRNFEFGDSRTRLAISVGGSEHFALPALHPKLQEVDVLLGRPGAYVRLMPLVSAAIASATALPPAR